MTGTATDAGWAKRLALGTVQFGLDYGNPDFVKYADSYGAQGHRVESAGELLPTLRDCLSRTTQRSLPCGG